MTIAFTPMWALAAGGSDVTGRLADRLLRLTVTDEAGIESDKLEIELDNRDGAISLPRTGAELTLALGFKETGLTDMGLFVVDEVRSSGMPRTLVISAKAADMRASFKAQKTKSWHETSIGTIVSTIAGDQGLTPVVAAELAAVQIPHLDQTAESDMAFLSRLARQYDAVAKVAYGKLIFVPRGQAKAASGRQLPTTALTYSDVTGWDVTLSDRGRYGAVTAHWHDQGSAERKSVTVGGDEPTMTLPTSYPTEAEARAAAQAKLATLTRGTGRLTLSGPGRLDLFAEAKLTVSGLDVAADGTWTITKVTHTLDGGGLSFSLEGEGEN